MKSLFIKSLFGLNQKARSSAILFLSFSIFFLSTTSLSADNTSIQSANRIVSTSPSITETLFALGLKERVIAVTDFCIYPPSACELPSIGGMLNPNLERIVALNPDLIIHQSGDTRITNNAKNLGIQSLEIRMENLREILDSINTLGVTLNCQESAGKLLRKLNDGITYFKEKNFPKRNVLLLLGDSNNPSRDLYAVGPGTFLNELLELAGGTNIINSSQAPYPKLSKEYIIEKSPELIIEAGPESNIPKSEIDLRIKQWNRFPTIKAVKNHQIHFIGADYILIPGPRLLKIIEKFSSVIHPDFFKDKQSINSGVLSR